MILVNVGITGISFVLNVKKDTVLVWLDRAYQKAEEINRALLKELPVTQVELDEMWSFVKRKISNKSKDKEPESCQEAEDGRQWIWISYAQEYRLILAMVVGPRTFETALSLIGLPT